MQQWKAFAVVAAVLLAAASANAQECVSTAIKVTNTGTKPAQPVNESTAFDQDAVDQHFESLAPLDDFRPNTKSTFSCVDSRGESPELGTPGGDFAELATAIVIYLNQTGTNVSDAIVKTIFDAFMAAVPTTDRPFYYHTSDEKLHKVFHDVEDAGVKKPTVFPEIMPTDKAAVDAWLKALSTGKNQGCGHVRLMIDQFADFGLDSPAVPQALIKAFYQYWWSTAPKSAERSKVRYTVVQGPLDGHAVAIINSTGCPGRSPGIVPSHAGSQLFVYHPVAVDDFRAKVLTPFFVDFAKSQGKTLDATKYYNALKSLQAKQLGAVLTYLAPANALPLWAVDVTASEAGTTATNAANAAKKPEPATAAKATTTTTAAASAAPKVTSNHYTTDKAGNPTKPATAAAAATTTTATSATNN